MFFFKKRNDRNVTDLSWLGTDIHSHLIPGIDDGAADMDSSIELIKGMAALGYKKIITSPHVLWEVYPNTSDVINNGKDAVQEAIAAAGITVEFGAAAEYFIDDHFEAQLRNKAPLLTIKDNLVLVEFSMVTAPLDLQEIFFELQIQGYQPIVAHPERYIYLKNKKSFFDTLKDSGCQFQVNLLSLVGHYGTAVQDLAEYLVKKEYYDYAGTDLHGPRHLSGLQKLGSSSLYAQLKASEQIKNHLL